MAVEGIDNTTKEGEGHLYEEGRTNKVISNGVRRVKCLSGGLKKEEREIGVL